MLEWCVASLGLERRIKRKLSEFLLMLGMRRYAIVSDMELDV
jgi:hypothetical protein